MSPGSHGEAANDASRCCACVCVFVCVSVYIEANNASSYCVCVFCVCVCVCVCLCLCACVCVLVCVCVLTGRMGHRDAIAYLGSPSVVAASALAGHINAPSISDSDSNVVRTSSLLHASYKPPPTSLIGY